jgi:hypothetical protein
MMGEQMHRVVTLPYKGRNYEYHIDEFPTDWNGRAFTFKRFDRDDHYNVFICNEGHDKDKCDCADATFRERRCKHMEAIRALLVAASQ